MPNDLDQQLSIYLTDAHAIELQALAQVERAQKVAGDPEIAKVFAKHVRETKRHRLYIEDRLRARSWAPVPQKDLAGKLTGVGMAMFARFAPDTPGKLVAHAYSYERMEMTVYELLARLAARAGDGETALTARMIQKDERTMADRLVALFDRAVDASVSVLDTDDVGEQLDTYLADAHAIETEAMKLLKKAPSLVGSSALAEAFEKHLEETEQHRALLETRLQARGASPSTMKDAALRMGAVNLGVLLKSQVDAPAKLAAFTYAFEHLEIAGYELLKRVAMRAGDDATAATAQGILLQERAAAAHIHDGLDEALDLSLELARATG